MKKSNRIQNPQMYYICFKISKRNNNIILESTRIGYVPRIKKNK